MQLLLHLPVSSFVLVLIIFLCNRINQLKVASPVVCLVSVDVIDGQRAFPLFQLLPCPAKVPPHCSINCNGSTFLHRESLVTVVVGALVLSDCDDPPNDIGSWELYFFYLSYPCIEATYEKIKGKEGCVFACWGRVNMDPGLDPSGRLGGPVIWTYARPF